MSNLYYLVSDYFATGEGTTVSMMICTPKYHIDDYITIPKWSINDQNEWVYDKGVLKQGITDHVVLAREFLEEYGEWFGGGLEILSRDEFFERFGEYVPSIVKNITESKENTVPYFKWKQQTHYNYS